MLQLGRVEMLKTLEPESNEVLGHFWLAHLFQGDLLFQFVPRGFQLFQPLLCGFRQDSLLDGIQEIINGGVRLTELLFKCWQAEAVAPLQIHHKLDDRIHSTRLIQELFDRLNNGIFQPFLLHRLLGTVLQLALDRRALVVVMHTVPARAALADHRLTAVSAEKLAGEYVLILCLVSSRGLFVLLHSGLYPIKQVLRNDLRNTIGHKDIPVAVFSKIAAIGQNMLYSAICNGFSPTIQETLIIHPVADLFHGCSAVIPFESFQDKRGGKRVDLEILFFINDIADSMSTAIEFALEGILRHAANDLLGEIRRVILGKPFQNGLHQDAFGAFRNLLCG